MSNLCPTCNQTIPDTHPFTAAEVMAAISQEYAEDWAEFYDAYNMGRGNSRVTLRGKVLKPDVIDRSAAHDYEDYEDHPIFVVFRLDGPVGDQFFKMTGYESSYSGEQWDGKLKEVKATQKTITVYE